MKLVTALVLGSASAAVAEPTRNIELTVFDPMPATSGSTFQVQPADVGSAGDYVATAFASYASRPLVVATDTADLSVVKHSTKLGVGGAYAFAGRFEAGLLVPLYIQSGDAIPDGTTGIEPAKGTALGDVTAHLKARLFASNKLRAGAALAVTAPTATDAQFAGTRLPTARVLALVSIAPLWNVTLHLNAGAVIRENAQFANIEQGSGAVFGAAVSVRALERVFFDLQAFGEYIPSGDHARPSGTDAMGSAKALHPIEGLAGARVQLTRQLSLGLGVGRGLTAAVGEPEVRGVLALAYAPSAKSLPPLHRPEPPVVTDPNTTDSDFDKIVDAKDRCPQAGEDKDGFEDDDGCPDPDNDHDGVEDAKDKCMLVPEDKDGFADGDGCPDPDNDKDGVEDSVDKCVDKPETINGNVDDDGCPDEGNSLVISAPDRLELLESVVFKGNEIAKSSENLLDQLATTLRARADITRLRITVHVQPTKSAAKDQALSDRRATAVREWLVAKGINPERIEVKGFGGTNPLVPPGKKGAAQINDRIEMIILERN
jgi:hypothetical protein